ncbi:hypothetical protein ACFQBQ_17715 [Granulicella cerasi]|uniref:Uncharacterized protein n=1 Tax=Granulicella cerasi TaxID=741063 RepID=A0ABW1ZG37_9BACT|nr:hypothetical protein [Granulicella cerasi]
MSEINGGRKLDIQRGMVVAKYVTRFRGLFVRVLRDLAPFHRRCHRLAVFSSVDGLISGFFRFLPVFTQLSLDELGTGGYCFGKIAPPLATYANSVTVLQNAKLFAWPVCGAGIRSHSRTSNIEQSSDGGQVRLW